jgi:methylmalonyl-CoA/ethylmalonyl-CoA epimerase
MANNTNATIPYGWKFDHLGMVVKKLDKAHAVLSETLGIATWTSPITDTVNGVHLQFGRDPSGMVYELLQPIDNSSPVYAALTSSQGILNHVAYLVADLEAGAEHLSLSDSAPTGPPNTAVAYGGARIQFFVTPLNFVIELIEAPHHIHIYDRVSAVAATHSGGNS